MEDCVPLCNERMFRTFWTIDLADLKQASIDAHIIQLACDKPRCGVVNKIRLAAKYKYKRALKEAMLRDYQDIDVKYPVCICRMILTSSGKSGIVNFQVISAHHQ